MGRTIPPGWGTGEGALTLALPAPYGPLRLPLYGDGGGHSNSMNLHRRGGLSLGRILGIPVRVHWTWLIVLALVAASLAFGYFPLFRRAVAPSSYLLLGGVTAALFCLSLLAHELAHAVVARREQIPVRGITLWAFGGVAELADQPRTAGAGVRTAVGVPLTSLALAWLFSLLAGAATSPYFALPLVWLARTNLVLGLFNLVPAFPLDGGRVFRSALWGLTGELPRATRVATGVGKVVSWGLVGFGLLSFLLGGPFNGLWLVLIASFIRSAAAGELAYVERAEREAALRRAALSSAMSLSPAAGPGPAPATTAEWWRGQDWVGTSTSEAPKLP